VLATYIPILIFIVVALSLPVVIIAILFVVFDVETIFLFPWAIIYRRLALFGFIEMLVFLGILIVGYFYVWKKGALEWV
jgi:NADH-quinone oxidoreductase subunit A